MSSCETEPRYVSAELEVHPHDPTSRDDKRAHLEFVRKLIKSPLPGVSSSLHPESTSNSAYLTNGSRLYLDVGNSLEYAMPECYGIDQLVAVSDARDELLRQAVEEHGQDVAEPGFYIGIHKRLIGYGLSQTQLIQGNFSKGFHENYRMTDVIEEGCSRVETIQRIAAAISPFLVSRIIFNGAGYILNNGKLIMGQKATGISLPSSSQTTACAKNGKPWIITRDERHDVLEDSIRLQVCGDVNVSPWATRFTFMSTSIVLRLYENGMLPNIELVDVGKATRETALSSSPSEATIIVRQEGKEKIRTPIELNEIYLDAAKKTKELGIFSQEEYDFIDEWQDAIDLMTENPDELIGAVDWLTKQHVTQRGRTIAKKRAIEYMYDAIVGYSSDDGADQDTIKRRASIGKFIGLRMREKQTFRYCPARSDVEYFMMNPTPTRAQHRARFINLWHGLGYGVKFAVGWDYVQVGPSPAAEVRFEQQLGGPSGILSEEDRSQLDKVFLECSMIFG